MISNVPFRCSEIWNLDDLYRQTYRDYVAKGYKDVRATTTNTANTGVENDEPSSKKSKVGDGEESWENIVFLRTNYNDSKDRADYIAL